MTRALIIGYGSIGRTHTRVLSEAKCDVAVVTQQKSTDLLSFIDIHAALDATNPAYIVIANETRRHAETVDTLASVGFRGKLLVEKPLTAEPYTVPKGVFQQIAVAHNLRFHPTLAALRARLLDDPPISVSARCGQHLSEWRADRDFRKTYSSSRAAGGGVLRDLSHELDYVLWLGGPWKRVASLGGTLGALDIDADEIWSILLELTGCPLVSVQLNYLDRPARREIIVTTRSSTIHADMIGGTLSENGRTDHFACKQYDTYRLMHRAMLEGDTSVLCSAEEGAAVVDLISAIEKATREQKWITV